MFGRARSSRPQRKVVAGIVSLQVALALLSIVGIRSVPPAGPATETIWQGGTPVTGRPRVNDDRAVVLPQQRRNLLLQERADDQVGLGQLGRLQHHLLRDGQLDRDVVTGPAQLQPGTLGQAVE